MLLRHLAGTASFLPHGIIATRSSTPLRLSECSPQPARLTTLRGRHKRAAQGWETNADGTVWTITLRPGVMFHNGDELTAEDVVASLERWRRVGPKGPALDELERFEIIDDHTLALHFSSPKGRFLLLLLGSDENKAVIMPKEVAEASPEGGTLSEVVGTGPYRFVEYRGRPVRAAGAVRRLRGAQ